MGKTMRKCCVSQCGNTERLNPDVKMHYFPRCAKTCAIWIKAANNPKLLTVPAEKLCKSAFRMCSHHFSICQLSPSGVKLRNEAVPDVLLSDHSLETSTPSLPPLMSTPLSVSKNLAMPSTSTPNQFPEIISSPSATPASMPSLSSFQSSFNELTSSPIRTSPMDNDTQTCILKRTVNRSLFGDLKMKSCDLTPRKKKLVKIVKSYQRKFKRSQSSCKSMRGLLKNRKKLLMDFVSSELSPLASLFFMAQIKHSSTSPKNRRWSFEEKTFALSLFKRSPRAYSLLRTFCSLPCKRTLTDLLNSVNFPAGLKSPIISSLSSHVADMSDKGLQCILTFDEMSIKPSLTYNHTNDRIEGFEDDGLTRIPEIGKQVLVLAVQGLFEAWKQPFAYYVSAKGIPAKKLVCIIKAALRTLTGMGLNITATVCDMGTNNVKAIKMLGATLGKPSFVYEGKTIHTIFDPPHLLKCFRNLFLKYNIQVKGGEPGVTPILAKWEHILKLKELDETIPLRKLLRLNEKHINPMGKEKMKVKYAAEIFSNTVASAMSTYVAFGGLPAEANETASLIGLMDDLFDSCNASKKGNKPLRQVVKDGSQHVAFWEEAYKKIEEVTFLDGDGKKVYAPSKKGWLFTLGALQNLWKQLHGTGAYLETRNLNQDPLENFFGQIRFNCGSNRFPTIGQFIGSFKTVLVNRVSQKVKARNCEPDTLNLLGDFGWLVKGDDVCEKSSVRVESAFQLGDDDWDDVSIQYAAHLSAKICRHISDKLCCDACKLCLTSPKPLKCSVFLNLRENSDESLKLFFPSKAMTNSVSQSLLLLRQLIPQVQCEENLLCIVSAAVLKSVNFQWLHCTEHKQQVSEIIANDVGLDCIMCHCRGKN